MCNETKKLEVGDRVRVVDTYYPKTVPNGSIGVVARSKRHPDSQDFVKVRIENVPDEVATDGWGEGWSFYASALEKVEG